MGNGHYKRIFLQEPRWPAVPTLTPAESLTLALYTVGPVDPATVHWLDARQREFCKKQKCVGVYGDGELVGVIQHRFVAEDTNVYVAGVPRETVTMGAVGENLATYDSSILRIDDMLALARNAISATEEATA